MAETETVTTILPSVATIGMEGKGTLAENSTSFEATIDCPNMTAHDWEIVDQFDFWLEGVSYMLIGLFGLFGNIVSIYILTRYTLNVLIRHLFCFAHKIMCYSVTPYM